MHLANEIIKYLSIKNHVEESKIHNHATIKYYNDGCIAIFPNSPTSRDALIISVGIHGDETAPVEMAYKLMSEIYDGLKISIPIMISVGNLEALKFGTRAVDVDLNRCFEGNGSEDLLEHKRASLIIDSINSFTKDLENIGARLTSVLDLHSYVYPNCFKQYQDEKTQFAICVKQQAYSQKHEMIIKDCRINKVITDVSLKGTLVSYIATTFPDALAMVFELGHAKKFGENNPLDLKNIYDYLKALICNESIVKSSLLKQQEIEIYKFCDPLIKTCDSFRFNENICLRNFTKYAEGTIIAYENDEIVYKIPSDNYTVLFPWPSRPVGTAGTYLLQKLSVDK